MPPARRRRWLANPRTRQRQALAGWVVAGALVGATTLVQEAQSPGSVGFGWSALGYLLAVIAAVAGATWETQAALAFVDFAPAAVRRRATLALAVGALAAMLGCVAGGGVLNGGVGGALAAAVVAVGLSAAAGGGAAVLATRGADYAARKVDERTRDAW